MTSTLTFNGTKYELHYYEPNGIPSFVVYINNKISDYQLELIYGKDSYYKCFELFYNGVLQPVNLLVNDDKPSFEYVSKIISYIRMVEDQQYRIGFNQSKIYSVNI
jgi:hypothetical protein